MFRGFGFLEACSHRATCMRQAQYERPPGQFDEPGGLGFIFVTMHEGFDLGFRVWG